MKLYKFAFTFISFLTLYSTSIAQTPGACLNFGNPSDYDTTAIFFIGRTNLTLEAKVNWSGFATPSQQVILYNGDFFASEGYGIMIESLTKEVKVTYSFGNTPTGYTLTPGTWTGLSLVILDPATAGFDSAKLYVNGTLYSTVQVPEFTPPFFGGNRHFNIGANNAGSNNYGGQIDEVRFWSVPLPGCEIRKFANCEIPVALPTLEANYHFNQGVASSTNTPENVLYDASGFNRHMNLVNFSLTGSTSNWFAPGAVASGYTITTPHVTGLVTKDTLCLGGTITLNGAGAVSYTWSDGVTNNTPFTPSLLGFHIYTVTGVDALGCTDKGFKAVVTSSVIPKLTIIKDPEFNTIVNIPDGETQTQILGFQPYAPYTYTFTDVLPPNSVITGVDVSYEGHDQGFRDASGFQFCAMFINNDFIATNKLDVDFGVFAPYSYTLNAFFSNYNYGGSNVFRLEFDGRPAWVATIQNTKVTLRYKLKQDPIIDCIGNLVTLNAFGAVKNYSWSGGITNNVPFPLTATQIYTVTGTNIFGCKNTETVSVTIDSPTLSVNSGTICNGESFTILPSGGVSYTIASGSGITSNVVTPTVTTSYSVTGTSAAGCLSKIAMSNVVVFCDTVLKTYSGVTPNGDGLNDIWVIDNISKFPQNRVTIFNRWGNKLFDQAGYDNKTVFWPENSSSLTSGTYFYVVDLGDQSKPMKGWVELIKN